MYTFKAGFSSQTCITVLQICARWCIASITNSYKWKKKKAQYFKKSGAQVCLYKIPSKTNHFLEQSREHFSNVFFADVLHSGIAWQPNHSSHVTLLDWLSIALLALVYTKLQAVMCIKRLTVAYHNFMEILKMWKKNIDLCCPFYHLKCFSQMMLPAIT